MEMCCVSCKKNTGNTNPGVRRARKIDYCLYQVVLLVVRKNQNSLKIKKQVDY